MGTNPHPGQVAYEAYCAASDGKSLVSGELLPAWDDLAEAIRDAWKKAADAARSAPAQLELGPDGRFTLKLRQTIKYGNDEITELRFRKVKGRDMRNMPPPERRTFGDALDLLGRMCGQVPAVMDELGEEDLAEVSSLIGGF